MHESGEESSHKSNAQIPVNKQKSQRYIEHDDIEADLHVPESMQDFVYRKMQKKIEDSIEFVEMSTKKPKKKKSSDVGTGIRLLKGTDPITQIDFVSESLGKEIARKKPEIKRRIVEPDDYDSEEKLKIVCVDGERILNQTETKGWQSKKAKPNKEFNYREKNSVLYFVEPSNEFSALRKKNNWSESKIANFPWKNQKK